MPCCKACAKARQKWAAACLAMELERQFKNPWLGVGLPG